MEKSYNIRSQFLLGLSIYFTFAIRDIGVFLLPALFVFQVAPILFKSSKERKNILYYITPYVAFIMLFIPIYLLLPKGGVNRHSMFSFSHYYSNFVHYSDLVSNYLFDGNFTILLLIPLWGVIVYGAAIHVRKQLHILVYILLVLLIYFMWPFNQGVRFLFPIVPFIIFYMVLGLQKLLSKFRFNISFIVLSIIFGAIAYRGVNATLKFTETNANLAYNEESIALYNYIIENVPEDEIVGFFKPRVMRLFTGRNCIYQDPANQKNSGANYIVINAGYEAPNYSLLFQTDKYAIFKLEP